MTGTGNALYIASISKDFSSVTEDTVIYRIPDFSAPEAEVLLDVPDLQGSRILEFAVDK